jgi:tRNA modification GTPase
MAQLLAACLAAGGVLAHPGEFTYRAVRNGKLDLAQAESVAALIGAKTQRAARTALSQLRGGLSASLEPLSQELLAVSAVVEATLEFPEDDLEPPALMQLENRLRRLGRELFRLAHGYELGQRLFQGARAVLLGPVNAGKSSLLNALCGQARAIVDAEPGTTRDIVQVTMDCAGIPLELLDTAGLRDKPGRIEQMGIDRAKDEAETADALVLVVDGSADDLSVNAGLVQFCQDTLMPVILAVNKADLPRFDFRAPIPDFSGPRLAVSAHNGQGLEELRRCLADVLGAEDTQEPPVVSTKRQHELLSAAHDHVEQAASLLGQQCELELTAHELQQARKALARLLGTDATEDLLERIFSSFCIGK